MKIKDLLKSKKWVLTSELGPPKGNDLTEFFTQAEILRKHVDAINVTDQQAAVMKCSALACCIRLKERGFEPILQMTVRDKNRIALQSELLAASVFGIQNVLVLTGDPLSIGDHPDAKPVYDLDILQLMDAIRKLESGEDLSGKKLIGTPAFCIAAAANPCGNDLETEISKLKNKIAHGADFLQTQGIFDVSLFDRFHERLMEENIQIPVLAGIILLKSAKMARYMREHIPGIVIPDPMIEAFEKSQNPREECIRVAVETLNELRNRVSGFHLMALGWENLIPEILGRAGI